MIYSKMTILILILTFLISSAQSNKNRMAVLDLESVGVSKMESLTLTDRLRSELFKTGAFIIVERSEMNAILQEQGFQMTGCTSEECAVEAGKLLNVNKICAGSIGKVGNLYTIAARIIDVESGAVDRSVTEDCQCPIERVLTNSIRNVALKLSGRMSTAIGPSVTIPSEGRGDLYVKSNPPGAEIYLNDVQTGQLTPSTLRNVAAGKHLIKVVKQDLIGTKSVTVRKDDIIQETIELGQGKGSLKIYSNPPEASISIDGKFLGKTPYIAKDLPVGDHILSIELEGFEILTKTVNVTFNELQTIEEKLQKMGSLEVKSFPDKANIFLNSKMIGNTPLSNFRLGQGNYQIILRKEGFADYTENIQIVPERSYNIEGKLLKSATLVIESNPSKADVYLNGQKKGLTPITLAGINPGDEISLKISKNQYEIFENKYVLTEGQYERRTINLEKFKGRLQFDKFPGGTEIEYNGKKVSLTNKEMELPVGRYNFTLTSPGYLEREYSIEVKNNISRQIDVDLAKKTKGSAFTRSLFVPGWGQAYQGKTTRSWVYGITFYASVAGVFYFANDHNQAVSDYEMIQEEYDKAVDPNEIDRIYSKLEQQYSEIDQAKSTRNAFIFAAGAIWIWNIVDVFVLPPSWQGDITMTSKLDRGQFYAGLKFKF